MSNYSVANICATDWFLKAKGKIYLFPENSMNFRVLMGFRWSIGGRGILLRW
jgi:hypothetical protein